MTADATFWDRIAVKYAARPIKDMTAYEKTMARTRAWLGAQDNVLELGCGSGSTALLLAPDLGKITATDISGGMIAIGKEKAAAQGASNIEFMQATTHDPRLLPESYDTVLAFNLLHLIEDLDQSLSRVHTLLRPGGLFISKTVCLGNALHFKAMVWVMQKFGRAPFVRFMDVPELEAALGSKGFEIVETGNYPAKPISRFIVARKI
ncbi:putative methyltransferase YcgJ [Roseovarius litorisediminis]|uniref:Putative methyltransferase YcgJ n=1 Tax=Roseovarius litorisediminis TaxID=1312363 RepID=A0A1Y5TEJ1_9RHOB|nr:class I SAM-dependent methyltransferase [Roseovarius litorisediminis]SLN61949.1 putative methyltransferase YcgJ [Roseovarius litorisediminis]